MRGLICIIEDEADMCEYLEETLGRREFEISTYQTGTSGLAAIAEKEFDTVLVDINLPDISGLQVCAKIIENIPDVPVIVMTAFGNMETAISAIRAGAYDFVTKPLDIEILSLALDRAVRYRNLQETVKKLSDNTNSTDLFGDIIGQSQAMEEMFKQLRRIADSEATLLITGESGVGKELTAQAVHSNSRREKKPLISINCAAMPGQLLESELFGYVKGAFTDARTAKKGLFQEADGGTLFLDEIGEIPIDLQPKLLRVLEERRVRPLGGVNEIPVDVRIIAATNRDLDTAVEEGLFREDLFYRLNVIKLAIPPLRSRGTDILLLANKFIEQFAKKQKREVTGITEAAVQKLLDYSWPGNVRELRNAVEHAVALTQFEKIVPEDLPAKVASYTSDQLLIPSEDPMDLVSLETMEKRYIQHVLKSTSANKTLTARILKIDRKTLYRKLQSYENNDIS